MISDYTLLHVRNISHHLLLGQEPKNRLRQLLPVSFALAQHAADLVMLESKDEL